MTASFRRFRPLRSGIASLLLTLYLPACGSWHVGTPTPAAFIEKEQPPQVRVTRVDGSTIDLDKPSIRGDSLLGTPVSEAALYVSGQEVAIALSDIRTVAVRKTSMLMTGLVAGAIVAIVIVGYCASAEDFSPC
jgi:hypothetical protein